MARERAGRERERQKTPAAALFCPQHHLSPLSQVAPTIAAGSAQSRADVVASLLSAVLVLTGLQWLTLAPKTPEPVRGQKERGRAGFSFSLLPRPST